MRERINAALQEAQSGDNPQRLCSLRLIVAAIKDRDISLQARGQARMADDHICNLLQTLAQQHEAQAVQCELHADMAGAARERRQLDVVAEFLPRALDSGSVLAACRAAVEETGSNGLRDIGRCMSFLKQRYGAELNVTAAGAVVKNLLQ
ncbi:GatB/YqeY domain-containing protein [Aureimonas fodinaquatilis]|nr:GatB/YqeY domain-containing protein [Aureimonas fodinaquatilis]